MLDRMMNDKLRESELAGMRIASAAVASEEDKKRGRWSKQLAMNKLPISKSLEAQEAMRSAGVLPPEAPETKTEKPEPTPEVKPPVDDPVLVEDPVPTPVADPEPTTKKGRSTPGKKKVDDDPEGALDPEIKRDPAKASELARQGTAALNGGRRAEAEGLFNQAVSFDRKCAEALIGLSDVYFDRGSSTKAQRYAEQAVAIAPNNGNYRIKLGDAYYNALRYRDALTQYEKAQQLGDAKGAARIAKVKSKLGE